MSSYFGDVVVSTGEYTDNQGQAKKRWLKLGAAFKDDRGNISLKLDALPMPKQDGCWIKIFEKDNNQQQQRPQTQYQQPQVPGPVIPQYQVQQQAQPVRDQ